MEYTDFVLEFAQRTADNLKIIDEEALKRHNSDREAYEVTSLINSFLGLLVFPQQKYFGNFPEEFPTESICEAFRACESNYPYDKAGIKYNRMLQHLRNEIAHQRLSVYPQYSVVKEISAFKFEDVEEKELNQQRRINNRIEKVKVNVKYEFSVVLKVEVIRELLKEMLKFVYYKAGVPYPN